MTSNPSSFVFAPAQVIGYLGAAFNLKAPSDAGAYQPRWTGKPGPQRKFLRSASHLIAEPSTLRPTTAAVAAHLTLPLETLLKKSGWNFTPPKLSSPSMFGVVSVFSSTLPWPSWAKPQAVLLGQDSSALGVRLNCVKDNFQVRRTRDGQIGAIFTTPTGRVYLLSRGYAENPHFKPTMFSAMADSLEMKKALDKGRKLNADSLTIPLASCSVPTSYPELEGLVCKTRRAFLLSNSEPVVPGPFNTHCVMALDLNGFRARCGVGTYFGSDTFKYPAAIVSSAELETGGGHFELEFPFLAAIFDNTAFPQFVVNVRPDLVSRRH